MKRRDWTKEELNLLKKMAGKATVIDIADILNRSYDSIEMKARRLGLNLSYSEKSSIIQVDLNKRRRGKEEIGEAKRFLEVSQKQFLDYKFPFIKAPKVKKAKQYEDAVLIWSDQHTGMVNRAPNSGLVTYNDKIRKLELSNLCKGIIRLKELYEPSIVLRNLYIFSLGDNSTNDRIFEGQQFEISKPMGSQLLDYKLDKAWFINEMLKHFETVTDIEIAGNHGRSQPNRTAEPVENNFEWLIGQQLKEKFSKTKRVKIIVPNDYSYTQEIRGHRYLLQHGHEVRGFSHNSIEKAAKDISLLDDYDVICMGHYHSIDKKQIGADTVLLVNGAWIYKDSYAYNKLKKFSTAKQIFFRVSNKLPIAGMNEIDLLWGIDLNKV